jgi:hypothetical protein
MATVHLPQHYTQQKQYSGVHTTRLPLAPHFFAGVLSRIDYSVASMITPQVSSITHLPQSHATCVASGSAMAQSTPNPSTASSSATLSPVVPRRRRRKEHPPIDIDRTIADAREAVKAAQRAMTEARALARNERRKWARLIKKAAQLSPRDLDRIAILKKCGVWGPVSQSRTQGTPAEHKPPAGATSRSDETAAAGSVGEPPEEGRTEADEDAPPSPPS